MIAIGAVGAGPGQVGYPPTTTTTTIIVVPAAVRIKKETAIFIKYISENNGRKKLASDAAAEKQGQPHFIIHAIPYITLRRIILGNALLMYYYRRPIVIFFLFFPLYRRRQIDFSSVLDFFLSPIVSQNDGQDRAIFFFSFIHNYNQVYDRHYYCDVGLFVTVVENTRFYPSSSSCSSSSSRRVQQLRTSTIPADNIRRVSAGTNTFSNTVYSSTQRQKINIFSFVLLFSCRR